MLQGEGIDKGYKALGLTLKTKFQGLLSSSGVGQRDTAHEAQFAAQGFRLLSRRLRGRRAMSRSVGWKVESPQEARPMVVQATFVAHGA